MKKRRDPSASMEHQVILAMIALYGGLCTIILAIHFLQPDRSAPAAAAPHSRAAPGPAGK